MTFYLSTRPIRYRKEIISPKECLKNNFAGLLYSFVCIGNNMQVDLRWLYEITIDDSYTPSRKQQLKQVFVEAMLGFSGHLKTLNSAKTLAETLTGLTYEIVDDKIVPVEE